MLWLKQTWTRFSAWYRSVGRGAQIGIGCGALIVACVVCGAGIDALGAIGSSASGNSTSANTSGGKTPQAATATAKPSASVVAQPAAAAVLGGPGQAFIVHYGPPTSQSNVTQGDLHFRQYPGVAQDFLIVDLGKYYGVTPGDSDAYSILSAPPPGQSWTLTTAKQTCLVFAPTDAHYVKRVITTGSGGVVDGWDDIYLSASLAKTFPASAFQDASQNPAPDGSFDIMYLYASTSDTSHVGSCSLTVGEQQTQG